MTFATRSGNAGAFSLWNAAPGEKGMKTDAHGNAGQAPGGCAEGKSLFQKDTHGMSPFMSCVLNNVIFKNIF